MINPATGHELTTVAGASVDDALAAQWLAAFTTRIENPLGILV